MKRYNTSLKKHQSSELLKQYRKDLITEKHNSQSTLDKYLVSLSSGAITISILFTKNFISNDTLQSKNYLLISWILFVITIFIVLLSFICSAKAFDVAIKQTDEKRIYKEVTGKFWSKITKYFNYVSIITFLNGTIFLLIYVYKNM